MNNPMHITMLKQVNGLKRERGFSLVTAIFLLVVLAALGVAMVTISSVQHQSTSLDVQGVRAYQAARAGMEWGLYQRLRNNSCNGSSTVAMPAGTSLSGFTVTVTCVAGEVGTAVITATACNMPMANACPDPGPNNPDYVKRVVEVRL